MSPERAAAAAQGEPAQEGELSLGAFAAAALDFEEVRALFERRARTRLGLALVRALAPVAERSVRARFQRLAEIGALERAGSAPSLGGLSDPRIALGVLRDERRPLTGEELAALAQVLAACERLRLWLGEHADAAPALGELGAAVPEFGPRVLRLQGVVDERGRVHDEASPRLAALRRALRELERTVESRCRMLATRLRALLSDPNVHRRAGRAVLAVKAPSAGRVPGIVHDHSQSGESVFVEPRELVELQNQIQTARVDENAELARILAELSREILGWAQDLEAAALNLAELELAILSRDYAEEQGAVAARIAGRDGADPGLSLAGARHPLLVDQVRAGRLERAVPIDLRLGQDFDQILVTGPNTGGKTLALKTAGLAALCTRMGLPIPAERESRVPLYDGIVADIGDEQEVRQSLSTFASHMVRIRSGLARATPRTLVLLDEVGGGTDPEEGAALGEAILAWLAERRIPTLATTHLGKLKEFAYRQPRVQNASVEFDAASLAPRYRLLLGTPGESSALAIAARLGLQPEICAAAAALRAEPPGEVAALVKEMRAAREHAERARAEVEARLAELGARAGELERAEADLARRRATLESDSELDLEARVRAARDELAGLRALTEQCPGGVRAALCARIDALDEHLSGAAQSERRRAYLAGLGKGQLVHVPRLGRRGVILKVDRARGIVRVRLGKLPVELSFDELSAYSGP